MDIINGLAGRVNAEMNKDLTQAYSKKEVCSALNQMTPTKAPGSDGMAPIFYKKYQNIVRKDATATVLEALNKCEFQSSINHTFITLIPWKKKPEMVTYYRLISLCNGFYKLISKIIANILQVVLPHVISCSQSVFVPSRLITDNVLVACEVLHFLKQKRRGKDGYKSLTRQE